MNFKFPMSATRTYHAELKVSAGSSTMDMGNIMVSPTTEFLDQALILEERVPVRVNKDTIIYNASAFVTQPNDVVEDLLKKMPGIEVESDGTILAEGEEVEQVLVDGKDFFWERPEGCKRKTCLPGP